MCCSKVCVYRGLYSKTYRITKTIIRTPNISIITIGTMNATDAPLVSSSINNASENKLKKT